MDNIFVTIAVVVFYSIILFATNRGPNTPTPSATIEPTQSAVIDTGIGAASSVIDTGMPTATALDTPLFLLPDSAVTPDTTKAP